MQTLAGGLNAAGKSRKKRKDRMPAAATPLGNEQLASSQDQDNGLANLGPDSPPEAGGEDVKAPVNAGRAGSGLVKGNDNRRTSGPCNAAEAVHMRRVLGVGSTKVAKLAVETPPFAFTFDPPAMQGLDGAADNCSGHTADVKEDPLAAAVPKDNDVLAQKRLQRVFGGISQPDISRRVFVGGMPFRFEEDEVREYWEFCGRIEDLDLMRFPDSGRFRGIAFITFSEDEGFQKALQYDGEILEGTRIKVEPCKSAGRKVGGKVSSVAWPLAKQYQEAAPKTDGYNVAYVGNIAFEANEADIYALFDKECQIRKVRLHTDKDTGKSKGFAHVHFADEASLDRAMESDGMFLHGRSIKMGYAQPKPS